MEDNKRFIESDFVKGFMAIYEEAKGKDAADKMFTRTVGNNGYVVGQEFTLTGDIKTATNEINGTKQVYIVLPTKEGTELSLMSLMGVSSLKGYDLENEVEINFIGADKAKETRKVKSDFTADFDDVWKPASRNLLELAGMIAEKAVNLAGKKATFLGTAVKPIIAKKKGESNGEKFEVGYKRAIETKLWNIE
jgi:hypothetical protein